jgi:hypothetical protein
VLLGLTGATYYLASKVNHKRGALANFYRLLLMTCFAGLVSKFVSGTNWTDASLIALGTFVLVGAFLILMEVLIRIAKSKNSPGNDDG